MKLILVGRVCDDVVRCHAEQNLAAIAKIKNGVAEPLDARAQAPVPMERYSTSDPAAIAAAIPYCIPFDIPRSV